MVNIPGHPAELSDSVKLLLTGAEYHVFEIDLVVKSTYWHFLCQSFVHFGHVVCLQHEFEVKAFISELSRFSNKFQELCKLVSRFVLNHIHYQYKKGFYQGQLWSILITLSVYHSFQINLVSMKWIVKKILKMKASRILNFWWKICQMGIPSSHFKFM